METGDGSGLIAQTDTGPNGKRMRRDVEGVAGPLFKYGNFPKSPISPHLKLKELAHRKRSLSPMTGNEQNQKTERTHHSNVPEFLSTAEEAGLTMLPPQP